MADSNVNNYDEFVIQVANLTKVYPLYDQPRDRFKEALHPLRKKYHHDFYALNDISFSVKKGEAVGIVGKNGAGKSTLLKILAGVLSPTTGTFSVKGKIFSLLELGTGFNADISGIENVYFNGMLLGLSKEQMDEKLDQIIAFADIGEFINQPVKNYSSGMAMRLAIAVATTIEPEILLIDESFAVGDMFFRVKCVSRLKEMMAKGITLVMVGHDFGLIGSFCKRGIVLHEGRILFDGQVRHALDAYIDLTTTGAIGANLLKTKALSSLVSNIPRDLEGRTGNGKAEIVFFELFDEYGVPIKQIVFGQVIQCQLTVVVHEPLERLAFMVFFRDQNGYDVFCFDSFSQESDGVKEDLKKGATCDFSFSFLMRAVNGTYSLLGVIGDPAYSNFDQQSHMIYDFVPLRAYFEVGVRESFPLLSAAELVAKSYTCSIS